MTTGALVLSGSSGRVEHARCAMLAEHGVVARSFRWFGGPGQTPGICELPLESFGRHLDALARECDRLAVLGVSKGAEAALLLGLRDPRIDAVVAFSPTPYVWANVGPGLDGNDRPQRSSWTWGGEPLPFVPYDDEVEVPGDPPEYRTLYEHNLAAFPDCLAAARIPVEDLDADLVLIAGGDDRMWPSVPFAEQLAASRPERTTVVSDPDAGHRCVLPGEVPPAPSIVNAHGGTPEADARLGERAWPAIAVALQI